MAILVTGASGFLGSALIPRLLKKGHKVYGLSRHPPEPAKNLVPLEGDILKPDLGLDGVPWDIHAVHHLAAIHRLGEDKDGSIWRTNVEGTQNIIDICEKHRIPRLFFCSSAYTDGRNVYERSKAMCERMLEESAVPKVTIFKPSIIMGTEGHFYPGHFSQFVSLVIKLHQRAEVIRRNFEGTLRLPIIEPVFRIKGNPEGNLNLIQIDDVADAMARIEKPGLFFLTNLIPPTLKELVEWVGKYIMVDLRIENAFRATPLEITMQKMTTAFAPYLQGDDFHSDLEVCQSVTRDFIESTIKQTLLT